MKPDEYDTITFEPIDIDGEKFVIDFNFMKFDKPQTILGENVWLALFVKKDENDFMHYDDHFEAVFLDPYEYLKNLKSNSLYGIITRKTEESVEWMDSMIKRLMDGEKPIEQTQD